MSATVDYELQLHRRLTNAAYIAGKLEHAVEQLNDPYSKDRAKQHLPDLVALLQYAIFGDDGAAIDYVADDVGAFPYDLPPAVERREAAEHEVAHGFGF